MTLHPRDLTPIPPDTAALGQRLLAETDPYRLLGEQLADLLSDLEFASLYQPIGRAAVSPALLALVTLFQFQEKLPDRAAARAVVVRLDWKYALHLALDDPGFHYSDLCNFRKRLLAHERERQVFDTLLERLKALGLLKAGGRQRTDSLAVLGAVKQLSALETVAEALRLALRALIETVPGWVAREVPPSVLETYLERQRDYRLSAAERQAALERIGQEGAWLLERLVASGPAEAQALAAVAVLRTVWEQRYQVVDGRVQVRAKLVDCTELIITPHDPGVRAGQKRGHQWHGDKLHVTESADPGQPRFITDVTTGNAASGDVKALPVIRQHLAEREVRPAEQDVDSGYISGKALAESEAAGIELVGPPLADTSKHEFKLADFTLDRAAKQAVCPAGQVATKWAERTERDGSRAVHIQFPAAGCAACPLRARCTTSRSGRSLSLSEHYERLEARRAEARRPAFQEKVRARAGIEATLSELVRGHGARRHRYRGARKRHLDHLLLAAACNLKRLLRVLAGRGQAAAQARLAPVVTPSAP